MKFYKYITEFADTRGKLTEEELAEARAPHLNRSKLTLKAVTVHGKEGMFASKRWTAPKESPKTKQKKSEELLTGKKRKTKETKETGKKKNPNEGWETSKTYSHEAFGEVHTAKKGDTSISFESDWAKSHYEKNFANILSLDHLAKLANPLNLKGGNISITPSLTDDTHHDKMTVSFSHKDMQIDLELKKASNPFGGNDKLSEIFIDHAQVTDGMQGKGLLKQYMQAAIPMWDEHGVSKVGLIADLKVGGYAWAKYGFDFGTPQEHQKYTNAFKKYAEGKKVHLDEKNTYEHSWDIANQRAEGYKGEFGDHIGKEFMKNYAYSTDSSGNGNSWYGTIDLTHGSKSRTLLNSYMNGKVSPADLAMHKKQQLNALSPMEKSATLAHAAYSKNDVNAASKHYQDAMKQAKELSQAAKLMPAEEKAATLEKIKQIMASIPFEMHGKMSEPSMSDKPMSEFKLAANYITNFNNPLTEFGIQSDELASVKTNLQKYTELSAGETAASSKMKHHALAVDDIVSANKKEQVVALNSKGGVNISKEGSETDIPISMADLLLFKKSVVIHNHPNKLTFSLEDVKMASMGEASELWASSAGNTYRMKPADGQETFSEDFYNTKIAPSYNKHKKDVTEHMQLEINSGNISVADANANAADWIWQRVAKDTGMKYSYLSKQKKEEVYSKESQANPSLKADLEKEIAAKKPKQTNSPQAQLLKQNKTVSVAANGVSGELFGTPFTSIANFNAASVKDTPVNVSSISPNKHALLIQEEDGRTWTYDNQHGQSSLITTSGAKNGMTAQQTLLNKAAQRMGIEAEIHDAFDHQGIRYYIAKRVGGDLKPLDNTSKTLKLQTPADLKTSLAHKTELTAGLDYLGVRKSIGKIVSAFDGGHGTHVGGTTGGLKVTVGDKSYFVKASKGAITGKHLGMEYLSGILYKNLGLESPHQTLHQANDKTYLISDWVPNTKSIGETTNNGKNISADMKTQLTKSYGADVLLANWDSIGANHENTVVSDSGKLIHLDNGGALEYRAQGTPKGEAFGLNPTEMETFADKSKAPQAHAYYGGFAEKDKVAAMNNLMASVQDDKGFFEKAAKSALGLTHTQTEISNLTDKMFGRYQNMMIWRDSVKLKAESQKYEKANLVEADPTAERSLVLSNLDSLHSLLTTPTSKSKSQDEHTLVAAYLGKKSISDEEFTSAVKDLKRKAKDTGISVTSDTSKLEEQNMTLHTENNNLVLYGKGTLSMAALFESNDSAHIQKKATAAGFTVKHSTDKIISHNAFPYVNHIKFAKGQFSMEYMKTPDQKALGGTFKITIASGAAEKSKVLQEGLNGLGMGELTKRPTQEDVNKNKMMRYLWGTASPKKFMAFYLDYSHEIMQAAKGGIKVSHSYADLAERAKSFGLDFKESDLDKMKKTEVVDGYKTWAIEGHGKKVVAAGLADVWVGMSSGGVNGVKSMLTHGGLSLVERGMRGVSGSTSSASSDIEGGGADSLFARLSSAGSSHSYSHFASGNTQVHFDPVVVGDRADIYHYTGDNYGKSWNPIADGLNTTNSHFLQMSNSRRTTEEIVANNEAGHGGQETMLRKGMGQQHITGFTFNSQQSAADMVKHYVDSGVSHINGIRVDKFFIYAPNKASVPKGKTFRDWADTTYQPASTSKMMVDKLIASQGGKSTPSTTATPAESPSPSAMDKSTLGHVSKKVVDNIETLWDKGETLAEAGKKVTIGGKSYMVKKFDKNNPIQTNGGHAVTQDHLANEHLANLIYSKLGVNVSPNQAMFEKDGNSYLVSDFIEGAKPLGTATQKGKSINSSVDFDLGVGAELAHGFGADVLLGNWDVVGNSHQNIVVSGDGHAYRIDQGGAIAFGGWGAEKLSKMSDNPIAVDYQNLASSSTNPNTAAYFGKMSEAQKKASVQHVIANLSPAKLTTILKKVEPYMSPELFSKVSSKLKKRLSNMKKFS